jgi:hypothetical protein
MQIGSQVKYIHPDLQGMTETVIGIQANGWLRLRENEHGHLSYGTLAKGQHSLTVVEITPQTTAQKPKSVPLTIKPEPQRRVRQKALLDISTIKTVDDKNRQCHHYVITDGKSVKIISN